MGEISSIGNAGVDLFNVEAEQQILGMILCNNDTFGLVSAILEPGHFYDPIHAELFGEIGRKISAGELASPVTMRLFMQSLPSAEIGGPAYLVRLAGAAISSRAARDIARLIVGHASARGLHTAAQKAASSVLAGADAEGAKVELLEAVSSLPDGNPKNRVRSFAAIVNDAIGEAVEVYQGNKTYLPTGLAPLDKIIKGLGPGDMMLLGGAPGMGKTAVACAIAANLAKEGKGVAFASREMSEEQLANRMISAKCEIPYGMMRDAAELPEDDFKKWVLAAQEISTWPIRVIPKKYETIASIGAQCQRKMDDMPNGLGAVIIDYMQLVKGEGKSRYEMMTDVSINTKRLAGLLKVPVIGLVQLSRDLGERPNRRPMLTDIRESGQFEQDADQVVFCHREEYWLKRTGPKANKSGDIGDNERADWEAELHRWKNKIEFIVAKNRHGPTATAEMGVHMPTNKFWRLE